MNQKEDWGEGDKAAWKNLVPPHIVDVLMGSVEFLILKALNDRLE